jgi:cyclohexadieny/prephenate dehydrogenase
MTAPVFKQITIIGVGLIGGSIARAALEKGAAGEVVLFDGNADALKRAGEIGSGPVKHRGCGARCGRCFIACRGHVRRPKYIGAMKSGAILTDVGSVKGNVAREFRGCRAPVYIIPGHRQGTEVGA